MNKKNSTDKTIKARIFNIMQYRNHPITGETLLTEEQIISGLDHKTIKQYAYILHDKDPYTEEELEADPDLVPGQLKKPHWHIVLNCPGTVELSTIAKWFSIPEQYIDIPKGKSGPGKYADCVEYLTHESEKEQASGKHVYDVSEIKANYDVAAAKKVRKKNRDVYGADLDKKDRMRYDVLYRGKTLRQCMQQDRLLYMEDLDKLQKLRLHYIYMSKPPKTRINLYISGEGGGGKGLMSKAIARGLYPDLKDDEDIFYRVGAKGATFEGYDGQPVIIWDDKRAFDLLHGLGGRDNCFNVFESHPESMRQNVKFSSINLCNAVNIVNSVQSCTDFLDGLAGEYTDKSGDLRKSEDKKQAYRRFPVLIDIKETYFNVRFNKGFEDRVYTYFDYDEIKGIKGNLEKIVCMCGSNYDLAREISEKMVKIVTDKIDYLLNRHNFAPENIDDIRALFADFGTVMEDVPEDIAPLPDPERKAFAPQLGDIILKPIKEAPEKYSIENDPFK